MLGAVVATSFDGPTGAGHAPGGWWILPEPGIELPNTPEISPDLAGWRRERMPELPVDAAITLVPDWVCEILSPSHEKRDLHDKWWVLQRSGVRHYWIAEPEEKLLRIYRLESPGYTCILTATSGDVIRAEPFDAVELRASVLFGDEDDDE